MNDIVIFVVGLGVMGVVLSSAFVALLATDHPDEPKAQGNGTLPYSKLVIPKIGKFPTH